MTTEDQHDFWNGPVGQNWAGLSAVLDAHHAAVTAELLRRAAVRPGDRVLDVGAGGGALSAALASRGATVTAVDISAPLLAVARARGAAGVTLIEADAGTLPFAPDAFDLIVSQFGVMFFADSRAAFANLHRAAAPGGRLHFAAWAGAKSNPWFAGPARIAAEMFGADPADPDAPGPMRFRDGAAVAAMLAAASWKDPLCEAVALALTPPGERAAAADFATRLGAASAALRRGGHGEAERLRLRDRIHAWLAAYDVGGRIEVPARVNFVSAAA